MPASPRAAWAVRGPRGLTGQKLSPGGPPSSSRNSQLQLLPHSSPESAPGVGVRGGGDGGEGSLLEDGQGTRRRGSRREGLEGRVSGPRKAPRGRDDGLEVGFWGDAVKSSFLPPGRTLLRGPPQPMAPVVIPPDPPTPPQAGSCFTSSCDDHWSAEETKFPAPQLRSPTLHPLPRESVDS